MYDLMEWYKNTLKSNKNPIIFASEFHYRFIRIHPFDDGNGRIARILMNFILMQFDYPPVIIKTEDKRNYFSVLQLADTGNIEAFIEYIAKNLSYSLELMIKGAQGEDIEEPDDLEKEISLLEQQLNSLEKRPVIQYSIDNAMYIYKHSFVRLEELFKKRQSIFEKLYLKTIFNTTMDGKPSKINNFIEDSLKDTIGMEYYFSSINRRGLAKNSFHSSITFTFHKFEYLVSSKDNFSIKKHYDELLTAMEIKNLVETEVQRHKEFLNSLIDRFRT